MNRGFSTCGWVFLPIISTREFVWEFLMFIIGQTDGRNGQCTDGYMTDVMHDVWMCCTDNVWMGAMTDNCMMYRWGMYEVWMDGMDDAQTGAMTDIPYGVQMDGDFTMISCM